MKHPLEDLQWVKRSELHANDYNPNKVFPPELELLKTSVLTDGWTQPIVARRDGTIVDGFHRWTVSGHPELQAKYGDKVPVVYLREHATLAEQVASTVRHNRARGKHHVLRMADIATTLQDHGLTDQEIQAALGMEPQELERLLDHRGSPERAKQEWSKAWIPK